MREKLIAASRATYRVARRFAVTFGIIVAVIVVSTLTIDRIESGRPCRLDTKRRILMALGMRVADRDKLFSSADVSPAEVRGHQLVESV